MKITKQDITRRALSAIDLAIDFATLGEYGLEEVSAQRGECKMASCAAGREDLTRRPRGGQDRQRADRFCDNDWAPEGWIEPRRPAVAGV